MYGAACALYLLGDYDKARVSGIWLSILVSRLMNLSCLWWIQVSFTNNVFSNRRLFIWTLCLASYREYFEVSPRKSTCPGTSSCEYRIQGTRGYKENEKGGRGRCDSCSSRGCCCWNCQPLALQKIDARNSEFWCLTLVTVYNCGVRQCVGGPTFTI